jgi:REP element-mobilizing transposase RayT
MSHFRRAYIPDGSFFFTVVTERRAPILCTDSSRIFMSTAIRECRQRWPFRIDAMVLLDNHIHAIWTLPEGDTHYSARLGWIKKEFTKHILLLMVTNKHGAIHEFSKGGAGFYNAGFGIISCGMKDRRAQ